MSFVAVFLVAVCAAIAAAGELPSWIRNVEANTALEAAFFRMMSLPSGAVAFRRPPRETRPALGALIQAQPHQADLYSLRALEDEQQLDFTAAESDWKAYVDNSSDKVIAQLALADFYHRRVRPSDEIKTLSLVAAAPSNADEKLISPAQQRSWQAFERVFGVIAAQGLPKNVSITQYQAWIKRYPTEPSLYGRFMEFLVAQKEYSVAENLIAGYRKQFPDDSIFPVKAKAMVEYRRGSIKEGLGVYEQTFQPLWDPQLVKSYFDLLRDTQNLRRFRDDASAALAANPQDLKATARIFYYYQQEGHPESALQAITDFRLRKEASKAAWTSQELYICARLLEEIHSYPESARYYFALYNSRDLPNAQETAIASLTSILLTAPETPIRFGSGELSMYRDIATLDQGPGYLNGIVSLILNTTQPASQYSEEEQKAVPYFHRSRAAELLGLLDTTFPNSRRRPELHAQLLDFYANSGENDAVIAQGREFLASFPDAPERTSVAQLMADAYARKNDTKDEFAIYEALLQELAARAKNIPLGNAGNAYESTDHSARLPSDAPALTDPEESEEHEQDTASSMNAASRYRASPSFQLRTAAPPIEQDGPRSPEYAQVLDRYLARLSEMKQIPQALGVLRREIDRNPQDPGLYERLALFLDQNRLGSQQEEVYRLAMSHFSDKSWYDKLARFYLRHKRNAEFEQLTRDAISNFKGSDLEQYFNHVVGGSPGLYLRLNLYANQRFPHNPVFVRNLLMAYEAPATRDPVAWEALLRQHWFEDAGLRDRLFEFLSSHGRLESELIAIQARAPDPAAWEKNPAAASFLAYANLWRSHFEESAPIFKSLAAQYPAEAELVHTAASVHRSLAYFEPADTAIAAKIEDNFLQANPGDTETMARIGDIYADHEQFAQASSYWRRIPQVSPGQSGGYLEAATIYWDYFDFENALGLLTRGRERLSNPSLYAYEAGAIYENQRDYPHAVSEYLKGALTAPGSSAELRLLQLARRPKLHDLVDQSTANIAALPNPPMPAVYLRVKVLEAQERKSEMESFLDAIANATSSIEEAEEIETLAQQKSLEAVRRHAIEKLASLTTDPVTRLQLRYALIRMDEDHKDYASAQKNIEILYRENPKILGVVRSTVDFYWRRKMQSQAISVLLQASKDAYPALSVQFIDEAARKSTEAKQFQQARDLLHGLLNAAPYNGEYLAAMADTYAQSGDDRGLQQFYLDKIVAFRNAPLSASERKTQIATLRRGLIPALTRMNDYSGAIDQYIELINNFPDDDSLVKEAGLYALRYQRQRQLVDFYTKTVTQSPRDYRWSMVLAHVQTILENYPAAIDTYAKAIAIRPDRSDFYSARAELEERLMRFDDAAVEYERIYELAYKDPQWMEKIAIVRTRQGRKKDAVSALKVALIEGRPESPSNYFEVARRLEIWGMLDEARSFAEQGISKAGEELLASGENHAGAKIYVRIMTRMRQHEQAYVTLLKALDDSANNLPVLKEQMQQQGLAAITDAQWRDHLRQSRIETARAGMAASLAEMGRAANAYFTPEERLAFAHFAESKRGVMSPDDAERFAIPLAVSAELADQEARWRFEVLMHQAKTPNRFLNLQPLVDLQRRRGRFAELGQQIEQLASIVSLQQRSSLMVAAADAYRAAEDEQSELRALTAISSLNNLDTNHQQRFFELLLKTKPDELVRIASVWAAPAGQQAADYVVAHGTTALTHAVVLSRGQPRPPVWNKAYDALVGLYFAEPTPGVNNSFIAALSDDPIGARIGKPIDRTQQLAGDTWFYYGSRYGEYLGVSKLGDPEDFLPSILEESPVTASSYLTLADYFEGVGDTKRAIADYEHALELSPDRPDIYNKLAVAYYKQGNRAEALAEWKQAFTVLSKQLDSSRLPENFWRDFGHTCDQLRSRHLFAELKPDADAIVRVYLRHNGTWLSNAILHPAYVAQGDPAAATGWLLDITSAAPDPARVLGDVVDISWIPLAQRAPICQRILELKENAVVKLDGIERQNAQQELASWQIRWIEYLVRANQYSAAAAALSSLPQDTKDAQSRALASLELRVAARLGTLDTILAAYKLEPPNAPSPDILRAGAQQLSEAGDTQSARKILEMVFAREIENHQLVAANFLGLADIRLASGDTAGALDLLRRLVVAVGSPFENLDPAAMLLEKSGHNAEAVEFLDELVTSAPWDASYRLRLAAARFAAHQDQASAIESLSSIAGSSTVLYELRLKAAVALGSQSHPNLGSDELNLLASAGPINLVSADKFYFYDARMKASELTSDLPMKMQLLSHCVIDFPRRDSSRVPLFQAAMQAGSDAYALGIIEPLLPAQFVRNLAVLTSADEDQNASSEDEQNKENDLNFIGGPTAHLSRIQRAHLAEMIADAMSQQGRLGDALFYYQAARVIEPSPALRKVLTEKIAKTRSTLSIEHENASRQPLLHEALEQDRVVRPRLLATGARMPRSSPVKREVKQ